MTERIEVCRTDELPPGERVVVGVKGVEVGVFNLDGEYHALLNSCPHQHGPLCEGTLAREIVGYFPGPGLQVEQRYSGETTVVCPWHGWSFDARTGEHSGDRSTVVPTYDIVEERGAVYLVV